MLKDYFMLAGIDYLNETWLLKDGALPYTANIVNFESIPSKYSRMNNNGHHIHYELQFSWVRISNSHWNS